MSTDRHVYIVCLLWVKTYFLKKSLFVIIRFHFSQLSFCAVMFCLTAGKCRPPAALSTDGVKVWVDIVKMFCLNLLLVIIQWEETDSASVWCLDSLVRLTRAGEWVLLCSFLREGVVVVVFRFLSCRSVKFMSYVSSLLVLFFDLAAATDPIQPHGTSIFLV